METAAVLPAVVSVVVLLAWLLSFAATQVRVVDAAREAARVAARGDGVDAARDGAGRIAPPGASVEVGVGAELVRVRVSARVEGPGGLLAFLPSPTVDAEAVAVREER